MAATARFPKDFRASLRHLMQNSGIRRLQWAGNENRPGVQASLLIKGYLMYNASDLRKGLKLQIDGEPYIIIEFQFSKPGKGQALYRCKLRNMITGVILDRTYRSVDTFEPANLEERKMQYLYSDGESAVFMDLESSEQESVPLENVAGERKFLKEGLEVDVSYYEHEIISIDLPIFVELKITHAEPGLRGDTATTTFKTAEVETGSTIQVPLFINEGDAIKVDTRSGEYMERV